MTEVLDHVIAAIGPASEAQASAARDRLRRRLPVGESLGAVERLAARLAGARHAPRPAVARKTVVIAAADHGVADPGVDLGEQAPTVIAVRHVGSGQAAVNAAARTAGARIVLVDAGVRGGHDLGPGVVPFRIGDGTADITRGAAMTPVDAIIAVQTGIALLFSLADDGLDVCALGQIATGAGPVSAALIAALADAQPGDFGVDADAVAAALAQARPDRARPMDALAQLGGYELGLLAGLILGAASINVPVILDDHGTWAAALVAARLQPAVTGYLIASHSGGSPGHRAALAALGLEPLFELGLAHGEGTGAALALPLVDSAAGLLQTG